MNIHLKDLDRPRSVVDIDISATLTEKRKAMKIKLIAMPFVSAHRPSIQVGLLSAIAQKNYYSCSTYHASIDLANAIGLEKYESLCSQRRRSLGDWLYSKAAFGNQAPDQTNRFLVDFREDIPPVFEDMDELIHIREVLIPEHLDRISKDILSDSVNVVGFTCSFQQNVASFALAKTIKIQSPETITLFGGANFEAPMGNEYVRNVECIDYAIAGEADIAFCEFLDALVEGRSPAKIRGVIAKGQGTTYCGDTLPVSYMDELPTPNYDEYFEKSDKQGIIGPFSRRSIYVPFESSRGCWWGQKKHCTFCGLNGKTMTYRAKSSSVLLDELSELNLKYRSYHLEAVDNILEPKYLKDFFPEVAQAGLSYQFFFEVKSNLSKNLVKTLSQGGVERIQPGIESLSTDILKLMDKGVSAIVNVNLLRWCRYYNIQVGWNVLWGFPGEEAKDYTEQAALFNQLHHLDPPSGGGRVWLERFSPMFRDKERFPTRWCKPEASYEYIYPTNMNLNNLAYFFEYEFVEHSPDKNFVEIKKSIEQWQANAELEKKPYMTLWNGADFIQVEDGRNPENVLTHTWKEPLASIYRACMSKPVSTMSLLRTLSLTVSSDELEKVLLEFVNRGVMMNDGNQFLSLAIPARR
ncbi:MAG: RiPP maturation radical SAM C-methyltransferase [Pseudomonadales bacterium]|nr:RiPP maturation radical SAM C-methyltransferase [Pseudomonadales bacterium]